MSIEKYNCIEASTGTQKCFDNEKFWCLTNDGSCHANRESDNKPVGLDAPVLMQKWGLSNIDVGIDDEYKLFGPAVQVEKTRDELRRLYSKGKTKVEDAANIKIPKYDLMVKAHKAQVDLKPILNKQEVVNMINSSRIAQKAQELEKEKNELRHEQLMLGLLQRDVRYVSKVERERIRNDIYASHVLIRQEKNEEARNTKIERHLLSHVVAKSLSGLASSKLKVINDSKNIVFFTIKRIAYEMLEQHQLSEDELIQRMIIYIDTKLNVHDYIKGWAERRYIIENVETDYRGSEQQIRNEIIEYFKREAQQRRKITVTTEIVDTIHREIDMISKGLLTKEQKEIIYKELIKPEEIRLSGIVSNKSKEELLAELVRNVVKKALINPFLRPSESVIITSTSINKKAVINYIPIKSASVNSEVKELFMNVMGMR